MAWTSRRTTIINIFGILGYLSIIMQWLWLLVIVAHPLLSSNFSLFLPDQPVPSVTTPVASTPSPVVIGFVIIVTILIFAMTFYILWKLPKRIGLQGARATKRTATVLVPVITHHKKISKKRRLRVSYQVVLGSKLLLMCVPLVGLVFAQPINGLDARAIWTVGIFCGLCSFIYFGIQQLSATLLNVKTSDLW